MRIWRVATSATAIAASLIAPGTATATWSPVAKWTAGNAGGDQLLPGGIAVGADRQVYVTVFGGAADDQYVEVYAQPATGAPDGTSVTTFGELGTGNGQFEKPLGVDTDPDGNVYVSDFERSDVQTFDTDHAYQDTFGTFGTAAGQIKYPSDVTATANGVYVTDQNNNRVMQFDLGGTFLRGWGKDVGGSGQNTCTTSCATGVSGVADGEFQSGTGIGADASGDIYVADTSDRIQRFSSTGVWEMTINLSALVTSPSAGTLAGLTVDDEGRIFVVDDGNDDRILVFSPTGQFLEQIGTLGTADGQLTAPRDVELDALGFLYVTESQTFPIHRRVQVFKEDGTDPDPDPDPDPTPDPTPIDGTTNPPPVTPFVPPGTTTLPPVLPPRPPTVARPRKPTQTVTSPFKVNTGLIVTCYPPGTVCDSKLTAYIDAALGPSIASASAAKRLTVGRASFATPVGQKREARFKLNKKGVKALKKRKRLKVQLVLKTTSAGVAPVTTKQTLTLKLKRKR